MLFPYTDRIVAVAAKVEAVPGTYTEPSWVTDTVLLANIPTITLEHIEDTDRQDVITGTLIDAPRAAPPSSQIASLELVTEWLGKGSAAGIPQQDALFRAAAFGRTVDSTPGSEKVDYFTLDEQAESCSVIALSAKKVYRLAGVVAVPRIACAMNARCFVHFTLRGIFRNVENAQNNPQQLAVNPAITTPGTIPPLMGSGHYLGLSAAAAEWGPNSVDIMHVRSFELDFQTQPTDLGSASVPGGVRGFVVTGRRTQLSMEVEQVPLSTFNPYDAGRSNGIGTGAMIAHDLRPFLLVGNGQYNRLKIRGGHWPIRMPEDVSANGVRVWRLIGQLSNFNAPAGGPGNREIVLTAD